MDESVTGSANFFGPMTIETATSPEDLAALALVVERHGRRIAVAELEHDLAADPDTRFFLARHEGRVVGSGVGKRSSIQETLYAMARVLPEARRQGAGSALYEALSAHAQSLGLRQLSGRVFGPEGLRFALSRGFEEFGREIESVLTITSPRTAMPPPPGVDITSLGERPDLAPAAHAIDAEAVPDIPTGAELAAGPYETWRATNLEGPSALPHACTVALAGGEVVGYAALLARVAARHGRTPTHSRRAGMARPRSRHRPEERTDRLGGGERLPAARHLQRRGERGDARDQRQAGIRAAAAGRARSRPARPLGSRAMHLRPPSVDHGIMSFVWAFLLGVLLWAFMLGIGISKATSFIVAALVACGIFLYVRLYGEDEPRRRSSS